MLFGNQHVSAGQESDAPRRRERRSDALDPQRIGGRDLDAVDQDGLLARAEARLRGRAHYDQHP
jgi:hypothetical protein